MSPTNRDVGACGLQAAHFIFTTYGPPGLAVGVSVKFILDVLPCEVPSTSPSSQSSSVVESQLWYCVKIGETGPNSSLNSECMRDLAWMLLSKARWSVR